MMPPVARICLSRTPVMADVHARGTVFGVLFPLHTCEDCQGGDLPVFLPYYFSSTHAGAGPTVSAGRRSVNICGMCKQVAHAQCLIKNGFLKQMAQRTCVRHIAELASILHPPGSRAFPAPPTRGRSLLPSPRLSARAGRGPCSVLPSGCSYTSVKPAC